MSLHWRLLFLPRHMVLPQLVSTVGVHYFCFNLRVDISFGDGQEPERSRPGCGSSIIKQGGAAYRLTTTQMR